MFKRLFAPLLLLFILAFAAFPAQAQMPSEAELMAAFAQESPLSQADIDVFIGLMPKMSALDGQDMQALNAVFEEAGLTPERGFYLTSKISLTMMLAANGGDTSTFAEQGIPDSLIPNADELALINSNMDALMAVMTAQP